MLTQMNGLIKMMNKLKELLDYMIEEKYISENNKELINTVLSNLEKLLISFTMIEVSQSRELQYT